MDGDCKFWRIIINVFGYSEMYADENVHNKRHRIEYYSLECSPAPPNIPSQTGTNEKSWWNLISVCEIIAVALQNSKHVKRFDESVSSGLPIHGNRMWNILKYIFQSNLRLSDSCALIFTGENRFAFCGRTDFKGKIERMWCKNVQNGRREKKRNHFSVTSAI